MRLELGRQAPLQFSSETPISPSYGRLSARVGANLRFGVAEALATESLLGASAGAWATSSRRARSPSSGGVVHGLGHPLGLTSTPATRRMITWGFIRRRRSRFDLARVVPECVVLRRRVRDVLRDPRHGADVRLTLRHRLRQVLTASCRFVADRASYRPSNGVPRHHWVAARPSKSRPLRARIASNTGSASLKRAHPNGGRKAGDEASNFEGHLLENPLDC